MSLSKPHTSEKFGMIIAYTNNYKKVNNFHIKLVKSFCIYKEKESDFHTSLVQSFMSRKMTNTAYSHCLNWFGRLRMHVDNISGTPPYQSQQPLVLCIARYIVMCCNCEASVSCGECIYQPYI